MTTETTPNAPVQTADVKSPVVQGGDPQPTVESPVVAKTEEPAPAAASAETDPAALAPAADPAAPKPSGTPDWAQKRINELTAKRYEEERLRKAAEEKAKAAEAKAQELLAQVAKGGTPPAPAADPNAKLGMSQEEIDKLVSERAAAIAQANEFNKTCNAVAEKGKKEFADWDESLKNLTLVGALGKDVPPDFLQTAVELRNPEKVLHHLGKNLEEAERITKLPPTKMALEMARIEAKLNAPAPVAPLPPVSNAPAPVVPIGGQAKAGEKDIHDPTLSTEEYMLLRAKQLEEKRNRYKRV